MKTDVEELSPTRVKLSVEVPFDELQPSIDKAYREVGRQVRIPGFRPGRVPPRIIDQRVGRAPVLEQAVNDALPELYGKAVEEQELYALGRPEVEITSLDDGKELSFTAEVDIRPKIELPDLDGITVTVDNATVTPDEVEEYLDPAARAVRLPQGRLAPGRERRLRLHRPVRHGGRRAGRGRPGQRPVLRNRQRVDAGRPGRRGDRHVGR